RVEPRYFAIEPQAERLRIGSQVTLTQLEQAPVVRQTLPVLTRALRRLANVRVRNVATIGGNLAHADPHMDLPALLAALDANVVVQSAARTRTVALEALITGYMETDLAGDELIAEVEVPTRHARNAAYC